MNEEERQELELLRREKQQRAQQTRAQAALETAGVPVTFAPLLAGCDDAETDRKAEQFCTAYQTALAEDVRRRLPQQAPVLTAPAPQHTARGIRRIR